MITSNPYLSKEWLINRISREERSILKQSLLGKTIKIIVTEYGLFTEHGFPVAVIAYFKEKDRTKPMDFYAKVIDINPMITIEDVF